MLLLLDVISVIISLFIVITYIIYFACKVFYEMDVEEGKFMRTERKPSNLEVHSTQNALILHYEIEVQILGKKENVLYGEKKDLKKIIELPMLNSRTDCYTLAKEVVYQCDLIHHSRIAEVEQAIYYLKKRKLNNSASKDNNKEDVIQKSLYDDTNYNNLPEYIELLYEGMSEKIKGAHQIQLLARDPENLNALSKNETLISALGRVLREDWKRSIVLSTHLVFTFFCFSMYTKFHEVILKCKVGSICMDIIDYELRRYDKWKADIEGNAAPEDVPIVRKPCPSSASMSEIPRSRIPEPVRPKSGNFTDTNINKTILEGSVYEDLTTSIENINDKRLNDVEKAKRFRTLVKKQEHLIRVSFYLLLNIAEDESIEEKMTKRNIVELLVKTLDRANDELLVLVMTFLKKLSIMQCNKDTMAALNIIDKLPKLLDSRSPDLVHLTLKLLFNLSFDVKLRYKIIKVGLLSKFVSLLGDDRHQEIILKLLYHLSYEDDVKEQFSECVGLITDMLLLNIGNDGDEIIIALCINLAVNYKNAQQMVKKNRLQSLMVRAFKYQNYTIMKIVRNISEHSMMRTIVIEFVGDLARAVVESDHEEFIVECVGILGNLSLPDLDWAEIFKHFNMIKWIEKILKNKESDPELILQIVVLLGTSATDEGCSHLLCESSIILTLIDLLKTHQEDDEIVLQIVYIFFVILYYKDNIDYLVEKTEAPAYLIDLLQDNSKSIRQLCNACLNIISENNETWADRIRIEKFRNHNAQWLQMVDSQQLDPDEQDDDEELPPYLNTEYLSTAVVPPLTDLNDENISVTPPADLNKFNNSNYFEKTEVQTDLEIEAI